MSALESSSTTIVGHTQQSEVGGTSFLDLPLELREMVYDLCAPRPRAIYCYRMPFKSKPVVVGITLLLSSRQIHDEVSQRFQFWETSWVFEIQLCTSLESTIDANCSIIMSGLHDLALAKIQYLSLQFNMTTSTPAIAGLHGLESLLKLKSLYLLSITLTVGFNHTKFGLKDSSSLETLPFITGFVIRILSHIPPSAATVGWYFYPPGDFVKGNDTLRRIAEQYKSVRGSAYTSQQHTQIQGDLVITNEER